jgi:hypothetical protein
MPPNCRWRRPNPFRDRHPSLGSRFL